MMMTTNYGSVTEWQNASSKSKSLMTVTLLVKIFFVYYSISARIFDITEWSDAFKTVLLMNV